MADPKSRNVSSEDDNDRSTSNSPFSTDEYVDSSSSQHTQECVETNDLPNTTSASVAERLRSMILSLPRSKDSWPNSQEDYELKETIGTGATAVVHAAYCKKRDEKCAIKKIDLQQWNATATSEHCIT